MSDKWSKAKFKVNDFVVDLKKYRVEIDNRFITECPIITIELPDMVMVKREHLDFLFQNIPKWMFETFEIDINTCKTCEYHQKFFNAKWSESICDKCGAYTNWSVSKEMKALKELRDKFKELREAYKP